MDLFLWVLGAFFVLALICGAGVALWALTVIIVQLAIGVVAILWNVLLAALWPLFWLLKRAGGERALDRMARRRMPPVVVDIAARPTARSAPMWDQMENRSDR